MSEQEGKRQLSDDELEARVREELKRLSVSDVLIQTLYTISSIGYQKLSPATRDLQQARLAVEALKALVPVLKETVPEQMARDFNQVVANLQLAYAGAAREAPPAAKTDEKEEKVEPQAAKADEPAFDPEDLEPVDEKEHGGGD